MTINMCNNSRCMKAITRMKYEIKGTCYCKSGHCVCIENSNDIYAAFKHDECNNTVEIIKEIGFMKNFKDAQEGLASWAEKNGCNKCVLNMVLDRVRGDAGEK